MPKQPLPKIGDTVYIKARVIDVMNMTENADPDARQVQAETETGMQMLVNLADVSQVQAAKE